MQSTSTEEERWFKYGAEERQSARRRVVPSRRGRTVKGLCIGAPGDLGHWMIMRAIQYRSIVGCDSSAGGDRSVSFVLYMDIYVHILLLFFS